MAVQVVVHLPNEDPIVAEMDEFPDPKDNFIVVQNPRRRDGKALNYITDGATTLMFPWSRITFLEVIGGGTARDRIVGFFREDTATT